MFGLHSAEAKLTSSCLEDDPSAIHRDQRVQLSVWTLG